MNRPSGAFLGTRAMWSGYAAWPASLACLCSGNGLGRGPPVDLDLDGGRGLFPPNFTSKMSAALLRSTMRSGCWEWVSGYLSAVQGPADCCGCAAKVRDGLAGFGKCRRLDAALDPPGPSATEQQTKNAPGKTGRDYAFECSGLRPDTVRCWEFVQHLSSKMGSIPRMCLVLIPSLGSQPSIIEKMVPRGGFEPPTPAFSVPCSTRLSYLG